MEIVNPKKVKISLVFCWSMVLCLIPGLSYFGRPLQYWIRDSIGYSVFAWIIAILSLLLISALFYWVKNKPVQFPFRHLTWFLPLYLVLPFLLERVEERVHFISFGLFGFLSMIIFAPRVAISLCLFVSAGDELLQYFLPDRVGDWRDVAFNILASIGSALFVFVLKSKERLIDAR
jgi:VanZ family protein